MSGINCLFNTAVMMLQHIQTITVKGSYTLQVWQILWLTHLQPDHLQNNPS